MRCFAAAILIAAMITPAAALAADPKPQVSPDEYVKAIQAAPAPAAAAPAPAAAPAQGSACPDGQALDDNGLCTPTVQSTRGFSLATEGPSSGSSKPAPAPHRVAASAPARPTPVRVSLPAAPSSRLSDLMITFRLGSAELTEQGRANAKSFAAALLNPAVLGTRFEIAGHTDASGKADRNMALSQERAEAVKGFLVSLGVDASRLDAKGYGSTDLAKPRAPYSAANRRVEARRMD